MLPVVGARPIEQDAVPLPIEPAVVERPVGDADEPGLVRPPAIQQRVAHRAGVEPRGCLHHARIAPRDFVVAQSCIEVVGYARPQPVEIDIDEEPVAAGLDAGERDWEQIGQRRPFEPVLAHRRSHEGEAERQDRLDTFI